MSLPFRSAIALLVVLALSGCAARAGAHLTGQVFTGQDPYPVRDMLVVRIADVTTTAIRAPMKRRARLPVASSSAPHRESRRGQPCLGAPWWRTHPCSAPWWSRDPRL